MQPEKINFKENPQFPHQNHIHNRNTETDNVSDISFEKDKKYDNELLNNY